MEQDWPPLSLLERLLVDIRGASPTKIGHSVVNDTFAEQAVSLCEKLLRANILNPRDIVTLTPYEAQYRLYQRLLLQAHVQNPTLGFDQVLVRKVDSFQGQESPVV